MNAYSPTFSIVEQHNTPWSNGRVLHERSYPRISVELPVQLRAPDAQVIAQSADLSMGGLLVRSPITFPTETELVVRFNLPDGHSITTFANVIHTDGKSLLGLQFLDLEPEFRRVLAAFTRKMSRYVRRGNRISRRYHLLVRKNSVGDSQAEMAETVLLSLHGGLLVCRAPFEIGQRIHIWCNEKASSAEAVVVNSRVAGVGGLLELGFAFVSNENFWGLDFQVDSVSSRLPA